MAILALVVTILSVTVTLYTQASIHKAIANKASELASPKSPTTASNPIQLMSALSSKKIHPDNKLKENSSLPSSIPPRRSVSFEDESASTEQRPKPTPKGAGTRWTPL